MDIVSLIAACIKLFLIFQKKLQNTPAEARRKTLIELDAAIEKTKDAKDLRDLSKWLGQKL